MKNKIYHILNGDSLLSQFAPEIEGDRIVMREALMDGPINGKSFDEFVEQRSQYLCKGDPTEYYTKSVSELQKIGLIPGGSTVCLWFEDDLFCQVNLWYCIFQIQDPTIRKILIRPLRGYSGFAGYKSEELIKLMENPILLSKKEVELFSNLWEVFRDKRWEELEVIMSSLPSKLHFIQPAIQAQLDRLPEGKSRPEKTLTILVEKYGKDNFKEIFKEFCELEAVYGMGDFQVKLLLDSIVDG